MVDRRLSMSTHGRLAIIMGHMGKLKVDRGLSMERHGHISGNYHGQEGQVDGR